MGTHIHVLIRLHRAPTTDPNPTLKIETGGTTKSIKITNHPTFYKILVEVGKNGSVTLNMRAKGKFYQPDEREIYVGLSGIAFFKAEDSEGEKSILNQIIIN